jgi:Uma2 family endonuclease
MGMPLVRRNFTVDEYHRMAQAGILGEDDRVELIDGQVVAMTPIGPDHGSCVNRLTALFAPLAGRQATVSVQNPVVLGEHEEPQPDVTLLRYRADGYRARHPEASDVLLVIEVGDTSVDADRRTKIPLYARAGIPEAWLVNLPADAVECYREPTGEGYADLRTAQRGETLTPLQVPGIALRVDDILG